MSVEKEKYEPGGCNIGKQEIKQRINPVIYSFIFSLLLIIIIELLNPERIWRLLLFFPIAAFFISSQQVYYKFCISFAFKGIYNFTNPGQALRVEQKENHKKDKTKANQIIVTGLILAFISAISYYLF